MLKLYKNVTPNYPNGYHYLFDNYDNFSAALLPNLYLTFNVKDYRINEGTALIKTAAPLLDIDKITYIIDEHSDGTNTYYRCYFVDSAELQSGYIIFKLSVDYWGSYIAKASLSNVHINRCNRNVGIGVYDNIEITKDNVEIEVLTPSLAFSTLSVVFTAVYQTGTSSVLVNNASTAMGLYAIELKADGSLTLADLIDRISGIYAVSAAGGAGSLDAAVLKAYIVPSNSYGIKQAQALPQFVSKTIKGSYTFTPDCEVANVGAKTREGVPYPCTIALNPNYEYYVGMKSAGLKLTRTTESTITVVFMFIMKQDGVQVFVRQGAEMLDITQAFQVGLTSNDGNFTTLQAISSGISAMHGLTAGAQQISVGSSAAGAIQIASSITSLFKTGNAKYQQGGDGISNFMLLSGAAQVGNFYIAKYKSTNDETKRARIYGANYDEIITDLASIFNYNLIGIGDSNSTFVAADCLINGIPFKAAEDIRAQLKQGLYLKKL